MVAVTAAGAMAEEESSAYEIRIRLLQRKKRNGYRFLSEDSIRNGRMALRKLFSESDFGSRSCFRFTGGYFVEIGFIIREIRSHNAIPEIEIEAIIPVKLLVMHIMMSGCVDPFG